MSFTDSGTFHNCKKLKSVTIPNGVTSIKTCAFWNCTALKDINIPNSVTSIEDSAFEDCTNLINFTIPDSVNSISESVFEGCTSLTNIEIPKSVTCIEERAFRYCDDLENIYYGGNKQQWNAIDISAVSNEALTNAKIHCNVSYLNNSISSYSYSFANQGRDFGYSAMYRFPPERFQYVYGDQFAKSMNQISFRIGTYWSGNCYGISTTAAMLSWPGSNVTPSDFCISAVCPGDLQVSDFNPQLDLTLTQFIEAMRISQYSSTFAATRKQNRNQVSSLQSAMSAFEAGGFGPSVICIYGDDKNGNYCGHALLAYHLDGQYLYVYDCNHPNDGQRYITLTDNNWSYPIYDDLIWNSSNGEITYIQYETYLMDWYNRGRLLGDPEQLRQVMIFISAADATIADSQGKEVAVFSKGKMVSGIDAAFPIPPLGVTADGASTSNPQIAVWLPLDSAYRVTAQEDATVSMVNSVGESVNNAKAGQTVSVSLSGASFTDVSFGQYYYEPVQWAVGCGITNGTSASTFSPHNTCSRNHIMTFLWRGNGCPTASIQNPFTDISLDGDFGKAAVWAAENGLVSGTRFHGEDPCTRAEAVTYFWKLAGCPLMGRNSFTDVPSNADYAQAVSWAVSRGITKGTSESTFNPSDTCTRGQIMTFLYRSFLQCKR